MPNNCINLDCVVSLRYIASRLCGSFCGKQAMSVLIAFNSPLNLLEVMAGNDCAARVLSRELIVALNKVFQGKRISAEVASGTLGRYLRSNYHCPAY